MQNKTVHAKNSISVSRIPSIIESSKLGLKVTENIFQCCVIFQIYMYEGFSRSGCLIELHKSQVYFSKITFILEKILDKLICIGNMLKYFYCFGSQTTRGCIHIHFLTKLEDKITHVGIIIMRLKKKTVGLA